MSDALPEREVARVAALARLALTPDESRQMAAQLGRILAFAAVVASTDTARVPDGEGWLALPPCERRDEARASMDAASALSNAPEPGSRFFLTPRVLPHD